MSGVVNVWVVNVLQSSEGQSSLQITICKGTEEYGGGRIIRMIICNHPCSSVPLILDSPLCKRTFAKEWGRLDPLDDNLEQFLLLRPLDFGHPENRPFCKGTEEHEGGRMIPMIMCNHPCSSVSFILVIRRTILFVKDYL